MEKQLAWRDYHLEAPYAVPMASEQDALMGAAVSPVVGVAFYLFTYIFIG